jgi:pilus assembly protein CpaB
MRRGGRLILLLGIVIAVAGALFLYVVLTRQPVGPPITTIPPTESPKKKVVVARIDIPNNSVLTDTETFLQTADIPEADFNAKPGQYFTSFGELQGKVTLRPISATEPILKGDVIDAGLSLQIPPAAPNEARRKAFPLMVNNLSGVADQIKPGDVVDVIASFRFTRLFLRPSFNELGQVIIKEDTITDLQSTKTLVQNVQVLKIIKPPAAPEGTPTPGGAPPPAEGPPQTSANGQPAGPGGAAGQPSQPGQPEQAAAGETLAPGFWILVLAVTDQQAEIIKLSREQGNGITLVLRGRGDTAVENTIGATIDLLVSQFGLPLPNPVAPAFFAPSQLTPIPTIAGTVAPAAPTAPAAATTPTPTAKP